MTDADLIELIQTKTPEELSLEEIEELRRRLEDSAELRAALAENLEMERFLVGVLKPSTLSADMILAQVARSKGVFRGRALAAGVCAFGLLLVGVFSVSMLHRHKPDPEAPETLAEAAVEKNSEAEVPEREKPAAEQSPSAKPRIEASAPPVKTALKHNAEIFAVVGGPDGYFDVVGVGNKTLAEDDLKRWLSGSQEYGGSGSEGGRGGGGGVLNHPDNKTLDNVFKRRLRPASFRVTSALEAQGLFRLKVPWKPHTALRLAFSECPEAMKLHFWNGAEGITVQYVPRIYPSGPTCQTWAAYRTTRQGKSPKPAAMILRADDEERYWRADPFAARAGTVAATNIEIRHDQGTLTLSSGDVRVLRVACDQAPEEVYWEGKKGVFQQIALVRAAPLPVEPEPSPASVDVAKPADMKWLVAPRLAGNFKSLPDGAVELQADPVAQAWAAVTIPRQGVCAIVAQLDGVKPGSGVYLGDSQGQVRYAVGFFRDGATGALTIAPVPGEPRPADKLTVAASGPTPFVAEKLWIRLLFACGHLKCWISSDGVTWARAFDPPLQLAGGYETFGLYCLPNQQGSLQLRRFMVRELASLNALAPKELVARAPVLALAPTATLSAWLQATAAARPEGADPAAWSRACALRALASGAVGRLGPALVDGLISEALHQPTPWMNKLRILDEALQVYPKCDAAGARRLCQTYERLGEMAYREGEKRPYTQVARAALTAPIWSYHVHEYMPDALIRAEMLELAYSDQWEELYQLCRRVKFYQRHRMVPNPKAFLDWSEALASRRLGKKLQAAPAPFAKQWNPPLYAEGNKEGSMTLAEIEASLDGKAYRDACRGISRIGANAMRGLMLYGQDPDLLLSWPAAMALLMRAYPELRPTLIEQLELESRLALQPALRSGDETALELVALHYHGTAAAAEALAWLGDCALLEGSPAPALGYYRRALGSADEGLKQRFRSHMQLAAALIGRNAGERTEEDVELDGRRFTPAQWQIFLGEMRRQRGAGAADPLVAPAARTPSPSGFEAVVRGRYQGPLEDKLEAFPPLLAHNGVDPFASQCALVADGKRMLLSNRLQVTAYDLTSGHLLWRTPVEHDPARTLGNRVFVSEYLLMPMRPVLSGERIFVRRIQTEPGSERPQHAPVLVCLEAASGKFLWSSEWNARKPVISDPVVIQDQLCTLTTTLLDSGESVVSLSIHDPRTGTLLREHPLARLRDSWKEQRSCQVAALDDGLLAVCGGAVLCIDMNGNVRWLRQQLWIPPALDAAWMTHGSEPPLVADGRCFISQPGVFCVSCIDLETGAVHWRKVVPNIHSLAGLIDHRLIVRTAQGFAALDKTTGKQLWHHEARASLLAAQLCGPGELLYARAEIDPAAKSFYPCLVWVDVQTGLEKAYWPLDSLRQPTLRLGPLVATGNRLWTFFGSAANSGVVSQRDILELIPKGKALTPAPARDQRESLEEPNPANVP